jgi:hypothetical protein
MLVEGALGTVLLGDVVDVLETARELTCSDALPHRHCLRVVVPVV